MPRVTIVQEVLPAYRVPFFEQLRRDLSGAGIDLALHHGFGRPAVARRGDTASIPWAVAAHARYLPSSNRTALVWQPGLKDALSSDLVVVEHAARHALTYLTLGHRRLRQKPRLALWGIGRDVLTDRPGGVSDRVKDWMLLRPDWWFAYTEGSAAFVAARGFNPERITVVQNAVDTRGLAKALAALKPDELSSVRRSFGLTRGFTGLFMASLHAAKHLDWVLDASAHIHASLPDFQLLICGDGPDRWMAERAASTHDYVHFLGRVDGDEKARLLRVSDLVLNPGTVGLMVLDAMAAGLPVVSMRESPQGPEIEYLSHGVNGLLIDGHFDVERYAREVVDLLLDPEALHAMSAACAPVAERVTIAEMSRRFAQGVAAALEFPFPKRRN